VRVRVCVCVCVCVSFFPANTLFGTSPQIIFAWPQNRRRSRPYESPKKCYRRHILNNWFYRPLQPLARGNLLIPVIKKVSKKCLEIFSTMLLKSLLSKRILARLRTAHRTSNWMLSKGSSCFSLGLPPDHQFLYWVFTWLKWAKLYYL